MSDQMDLIPETHEMAKSDRRAVKLLETVRTLRNRIVELENEARQLRMDLANLLSNEYQTLADGLAYEDSVALMYALSDSVRR